MAKYEIPELNSHRERTIEQVMNQVGKLPLAHEPGEKFMYGFNTDVLGRVVEVASGMELDDYIRENITGPIGAETFDFYFNDADAIKNLAPLLFTDSTGRFIFTPDLKQHMSNPYSYYRTSKFVSISGKEPFYIPNYPIEGAKKYYSAGGGMTGTARDYLLFCQAMLNDGKLGEVQLLKPETAQLKIKIRLIPHL